MIMVTGRRGLKARRGKDIGSWRHPAICFRHPEVAAGLPHGDLAARSRARSVEHDHQDRSRLFPNVRPDHLPSAGPLIAPRTYGTIHRG